MNFERFFLKTFELKKKRIVRSRLFYSITTERKRNLEESCFWISNLTGTSCIVRPHANRGNI